MFSSVCLPYCHHDCTLPRFSTQHFSPIFTLTCYYFLLFSFQVCSWQLSTCFYSLGRRLRPKISFLLVRLVSVQMNHVMSIDLDSSSGILFYSNEDHMLDNLPIKLICIFPCKIKLSNQIVKVTM